MNKDIKRRLIASKQLFAYKLLKYLFISEKNIIFANTSYADNVKQISHKTNFIE